MPITVINSSTVKSLLLKPAQTSHFLCEFYTPPKVRQRLNERGYSSSQDRKVNLSCSEAFLPGSSLTTNEITDDYHGVTERFAYRRLYDNQSDFTFYVDAPRAGSPGYDVIWFFETWVGFTVDEQYSGESRGGVFASNYFYRMNFPDDYRNDIILYKFEKDYDLSGNSAEHLKVKHLGRASSKGVLAYKFKDAFPLNISSMPVSYESSQLLKCTVSFTYTRYIVGRSPDLSNFNYQSASGNRSVINAPYNEPTGNFATRFSSVVNSPSIINQAVFNSAPFY